MGCGLIINGCRNLLRENATVTYSDLKVALASLRQVTLAGLCLPSACISKAHTMPVNYATGSQQMRNAELAFLTLNAFIDIGIPTHDEEI
jgi:hypothetical protein